MPFKYSTNLTGRHQFALNSSFLLLFFCLAGSMVASSTPLMVGTNYSFTAKKKVKTPTTVANCGELTKAIREENLTQVKELLKSLDPNCTDPTPEYETIVQANGNYTWKRMHDRTPLVAAARTGNMEIVRELLDAGAKVDEYAREDAPPLTVAAGRG
ncbi:MAG: ankyrin repeat domain-containing protein, partial [Bacteroidota bacterium]